MGFLRWALLVGMSVIACNNNKADTDDSDEIPDTSTTTESDSNTDSSTDLDVDTDTDADSDGDTDTGTSTGEEICDEFDGIDLLVVIDNSMSMGEEQRILATGFFTLINSLVSPLKSDPDWKAAAVENLRVAVVTSDMGLQYGDPPSIEGIPSVGGCDVAYGDDGQFRAKMPLEIFPENNQIGCDTDGLQCPSTGWTCRDGKCTTPDPSIGTPCPDIDAGVDAGSFWTETAEDNANLQLTTTVACLAQQGTEGCGIEQQLKAVTSSLSKPGQAQFIKDSHLLAVLVVTDEEDCSIQYPGLFSTLEWTSGTSVDTDDPASGQLNTACNLPESNEQNFLFAPNIVREKLLALKNNNERAVVFAAIVGVPDSATLGGEPSPCEGPGDQVTSCLEHPSMELKTETFAMDGQLYKHFVPACTRIAEDVEVTNARPGRRFVRVAQDFGKYGFVYSICNSDWREAMRKFAEMIVECVHPPI